MNITDLLLNQHNVLSGYETDFVRLVHIFVMIRLFEFPLPVID